MSEVSERSGSTEGAATPASSATLLEIFRQSPSFLAVLRGPENVFVLVNDAYRQIVGQGREIVGRPLFEALPETRGQGFDDYLAQVRRTGEPLVFRNLPVRLERVAGAPLEDRFIDITYLPLVEPDGTRESVIAHGTDVTEHVRALAAAETAEARLRGVFEQAPIAVAVLEGPDLVYSVVSPVYAKSPGGGRTLLGRGVREVFPEIVEQGYLRTMERVFETGEPFSAFERPVALVPPGGGAPVPHWFNVGYQPLRDAAGEVYAIASVAYDVTEHVTARREAEAARAEAEASRERTARLQALTAALGTSRTAEDVAEVVVARMVPTLGARTGAIALRATDGDEALVLLRTVGFPEDVASRMRRQPLSLGTPITVCYRTGEPVWVERRDGPDGLDATYPMISEVWDALGVSSAAFVPLAAAGEVVGVISFAFPSPQQFSAADRAFLLTLGQQAAVAVERARLFTAERDARRAAEEANAAKSAFLSTMSHELRTPLNAIAGYVELIEMGIRGPVTVEQRADLGRVRRANAHLIGLITDILNFARLEAGRLEMHVTEVDVASIVADLEPLVAPQLAARGIAFSHDVCAAGTPGAHRVRGDAERIRQILLNLLTNAIKFSASGGRVALSCATDDATGVVRLSVADSGRGIPAAALARIFEPFVQVDRHLTLDSQQGVGLGLSISHELARAMGGDLTAESSLGVGSTFTLTLPRADA